MSTVRQESFFEAWLKHGRLTEARLSHRQHGTEAGLSSFIASAYIGR